VPSTLRKWAESLNCRRWVDFTTDTNDGQVEQSASSLIYTQTPTEVILCSGSRHGGSFKTRRFDKCFLRPRNSFPLEVPLTLFQRDRIFGKDNLHCLFSKPFGHV
jgi:hypothetical protein